MRSRPWPPPCAPGSSPEMPIPHGPVPSRPRRARVWVTAHGPVPSRPRRARVWVTAHGPVPPRPRRARVWVTARGPVPPRPRRARVWVTAALLALVLAGCGVRLDSAPPTAPSPDPQEQVRQQAARSAADLYAAAQAARDTTEDDAVRDALLAVEQAASAHHHALGGVWEPWPGSGPEATTYPGADPAAPTPTPTATAQDVLGLLESTASDAQSASLEQVGLEDGGVAVLLGSIAISANYLAADLAGALGGEASQLPAAPLPAPAPGSIDADTSRLVDGARYAFEVVAARSSGAQRDAASERAGQLAAVGDAVQPEEDTRQVAYDISGTTSDRDLAGLAELDVVGAYLTVLDGDPGDPAAVLAAATYAAGQARSWDVTLPALPGLS